MTEMPDYCVVGPRFVLRSVAAEPAGLGKDFPLVLRADRNRQRGVGLVRAEPSAGSLLMTVEEWAGESLSEADRSELLRLFARVCVRRSSYLLPLAVELDTDRHPRLARAMADDGFRPAAENLWVRPPDPFVRPATAKVSSMEEVYQDPFTVPWNFVPREIDLIHHLQEETQEPALPTSVLDLGCGFGKNSTFLEEQGFKVFGVDISASAVARCRRLVTHPERFLVASASLLPWPAGSLQTVLDVGCLHCLQPADRNRAIDELVRVLAADGLVFSRIFKPRSPEWVRAQPFAADSFGIDPSEVIAMFADRLHAEVIAETEAALYVRAVKECL